MQSTQVVPEEIKGLNWGGFFLSVLWGIFNKVWIALIAIIPCATLFVGIYLLIKGNELAWTSGRQWESVEQFKSVQAAWTKWGIGFFILNLVFSVLYVVLVMVIGIGSAASGGGG